MWKQVGYSPVYLNDIIEMTREYYGPDNDISNSDFLMHQYFDNPAGDALINLAVDEKTGNLAGQYIVCPMRFLIKGKQYLCDLSLNTLTRKEYHRQGIFTGLAEYTYTLAVQKGHVFCYGMPNPNSYPGFIKRLSFQELGKVPLMLRLLRPFEAAKEFTHVPFLSVVSRVADPLFRIPRCQFMEEVQFLKVSQDNLELVDQLWITVKNKYPIIKVRDASYIRFRYLDVPNRHYFPYIAVHKGAPVCFAVSRIMKVSNIQCAMLADFIYVDGAEEIAGKLLQILLYDMRQKGANLAGCLMLPHTQEYQLLKNNGFFSCPQKLEPQPFPLLVRAFDLGMKEKDVMNLKNWFFTMGDYDVI